MKDEKNGLNGQMILAITALFATLGTMTYRYIGNLEDQVKRKDEIIQMKDKQIEKLSRLENEYIITRTELEVKTRLNNLNEINK